MRRIGHVDRIGERTANRIAASTRVRKVPKRARRGIADARVGRGRTTDTTGGHEDAQENARNRETDRRGKHDITRPP